MGTPGFLFNKNGFSVSRNTSIDISYVVDTISDGKNGSRLIIQKWSKTNNTVYKWDCNIIPIIPYRLLVCNNNDINAAFASDSTSEITVPLFNPGITYSTITKKTLGLPSLYTTQKFIQINFTRKHIDFINNLSKPPSFQFSLNDSTEYTYALSSKITVDDVNAGIIVKEKNSNTDYIILSVVTKITYYFCADSSKPFFYTVPLFLIYEVPKNINRNSEIIPIAWSYGIFSYDILASMKINKNETGTPFSKHWNYNVLTGSYIEFSYKNSKDSAWLPQDLGSLIDVSLDDSKLYITSILSEFNEKAIKWNSVIRILSVTDIFSRSGYIGEAGMYQYTKKYNDECIPMRISSSFIGNSFMACCGITKGDIRNNILTNSVIVTLLEGTTLTTCRIADCMDVDIQANENSGSFILYLAERQKQYVLNSGNVSTITQRLSAYANKSISIDTLCDSCGFSKINDVRFSGFTFINVIDNIKQFNRFNLQQPMYIYACSENIAVRLNNEKLLRMTYVLLYNDLNVFLMNFDKGNIATRAIGTSSLFDSKTDCIYRFDSANNRYTELGFNGSLIDHIIDIINYKITIGDSAVFVYSSTNGVDVKNGIDTLLEISGCSGIFARNNTWNTKLGGIEIDYSKTRNDFKFELNGVFDEFSENGLGGYGYWAGLVQPESMVNLYIPGNDTPISLYKGLSFAKYKYDGSCIMQVGLKLLLDGIKDSHNRPYSDSDFNLTNITARIDIKAPDLITKTISGISFNPPSSGYSIDIQSTKTILPYITYTVTKELYYTKAIYCSFIEVRNRVKKAYNDTTLLSIINEPTFDSVTRAFTLSNYAKGDYFKIEIEEKISGRIFHRRTPIISYVKDHRFHISGNPIIYVDGIDRTNDIFRTNYVYIKPGSNSANLKVGSININHEDFSSHDLNEDNVPTDHRRYPIIDSMTLFAVPTQTWPSYITRYIAGTPYKISLEENPPQNAIITYPNGGTAFAEYLNSLQDSYKTTVVYGGTTITLTNQSITTTVTKSGCYELFLVITDEFGQCSVFNITSTLTSNFSRTYRTKFGAGR